MTTRLPRALALAALASLAAVAPAQQDTPLEDLTQQQVIAPSKQVDPNATSALVFVDESGNTLAQPESSFGTIFEDAGIVTTTFRVKNTGTAPLAILNVHGSCGCTNVYAEKMRDIAPNEIVVINVGFNPQGRLGKQRKTVTVETDEKGLPKLHAYIDSDVLERVRFEPKAIYFAEVAENTPATQPFAISGLGTDFKVESVSCDNPAFEVRMLGSETVDVNGKTYTRFNGELALRNGLPRGSSQASLTVKVSPFELKSDRIPVTAEVVGALRTTPDRLMLRAVAVGAAFERDFHVQSRAGRPFTITEARIEGPEEMLLALDIVPSELHGANGYRVRVVGVGVPGMSGVRGNVVLKTDIPSEPEIAVPFAGTGLPMNAVTPRNPAGSPIRSTPAQPGNASK